MDGRIFSYIYLSDHHIICSATGRCLARLREYSQSLPAHHIFSLFHFVFFCKTQCARCSDVEQSPPELAGDSGFLFVSGFRLEKCKTVGSTGGGERRRENKLVKFAHCDSRYARRYHGASMSDCMVVIFRSIPIHSLPYERVNILSYGMSSGLWSVVDYYFTQPK